MQEQGYPEYAPEAVEDLLALEQAEPGNIDREEPCADEDCDDFLRSYLYSFRFETAYEDVAVIAQFDYITTDVSGDEQSAYRSEAIEAFTASMDAMRSSSDQAGQARTRTTPIPRRHCGGLKTERFDRAALSHAVPCRLPSCRTSR